MSEEQIIARCKENDRKAQKQLYKRYSGLLFGVCLRYASTRAEAEDVLQEAFMKIYNNIGDYSSIGSFVGWMKRIVINTSITHYHRNHKHWYHDDVDDIRECQMSSFDFTSSDYTREELLSVIQSLPEGYRMVFNMYAIEGYKHREIADQLGIEVNTSKSQYSRARKLIQKRLESLSLRAVAKEDDSIREDE